jgi:hypothetical protein
MIWDQRAYLLKFKVNHQFDVNTQGRVVATITIVTIAAATATAAAISAATSTVSAAIATAFG